jgi:hypothetical protein
VIVALNVQLVPLTVAATAVVVFVPSESVTSALLQLVIWPRRFVVASVVPVTVTVVDAAL